VTALVLLLVAAAAPLVSRRLTADVFSPAAVMVSAWCATLGLLALDLLPYRPLAPATAALIAGAVALFVAGAIAGAWLVERRPVRDAPVVRLSHPALVANGAAVLGLVGVAWFFTAVVSRVGWEIFSQGPELRHKLGTHVIPSDYLTLQFFCVVAPLLAWASYLTGTRFRWWQLLLPACAALGTLVTTDRTQFFTILLSGFFAYCFRRGRDLATGRLLLLIVVAPVILIANFIAVGIWTGRTAATTAVNLQFPPADAGTLRQRVQDATQPGAVIYLYATCSYPALDLLISEAPAGASGAYTLYPVVRLLQRAGIVRSPVSTDVPPFVRIERAGAPPLIANSFTFLYYPWQDFGWWGALGYSALVGGLGGAAHAWARRRRSSAARVLVAGQLATAVALTFFVNKFSNTASWYFLACTLAPFVVTWLRTRVTRSRAGATPAADA